MPPKRSSVQDEIKQAGPFQSQGQEATVALLRTASVVRRVLSRVLEPSGLTLAQYNALRIIRGAGPDGIATLAIRQRMIEEGTTITRLLDRLDKAGLIRRQRGEPDRRTVVCRTTLAGDALLDELDPLVDEADAEVMASLGPRQLSRLVRLLDSVRASNAERAAPRSQTRS